MSRYQGRHRAQHASSAGRGRHRAQSVAGAQRYKIALPAAGLLMTAAGVSAGFAASASTPQAHESAAAPQPADVAIPEPIVARTLPGVVSRSEKRTPAATASTSATTPTPKPRTATQPKHTHTRAATAATQAPVSRPAVDTKWTCAIAGCGGTFTSGFGPRFSPGGIGSTYHLGDDFATPIGTGLHALQHGTVTSAGWSGGSGLRIEIDFGDGVSAVYAHLSSINVAAGQTVAAGQVIGASGNTGNSTGPHLHLEIHLGGVPIDPAPWLRMHGIF